MQNLEIEMEEEVLEVNGEINGQDKEEEKGGNDEQNDEETMNDFIMEEEVSEVNGEINGEDEEEEKEGSDEQSETVMEMVEQIINCNLTSKSQQFIKSINEANRKRLISRVIIKRHLLFSFFNLSASSLYQGVRICRGKKKINEIELKEQIEKKKAAILRKEGEIAEQERQKTLFKEIITKMVEAKNIYLSCDQQRVINELS